MHISNYHQFSDIRISQGSVTTCLRRGGIFKHTFVANLLPSPSVKKKFENLFIFGEVMGMSLVSYFLTHTVYIYKQCHVVNVCMTRRNPGGLEIPVHR